MATGDRVLPAANGRKILLTEAGRELGRGHRVRMTHQTRQQTHRQHGGHAGLTPLAAPDIVNLRDGRVNRRQRPDAPVRDPGFQLPRRQKRVGRAQPATGVAPQRQTMTLPGVAMRSGIAAVAARMAFAGAREAPVRHRVQGSRERLRIHKRSAGNRGWPYAACQSALRCSVIRVSAKRARPGNTPGLPGMRNRALLPIR